MFQFVRARKFIAVIAAAAALVAGTVAPVQADTGRVQLTITKAGFIVGVGGGSGTLTFHGRTYRLAIGGIGIGSLGLATVSLHGTATNLRTAADIAGTYGAAGAGATFVGGGQVATLQNANGVVLQLSGMQVGFQVSIGLAGMTITLQ